MRKRRGCLSILIAAISDILWTVGVLLLLFVVWQLWWTNVEANKIQKDSILQAIESWDGNENLNPIEGSAWGILYIPAFGSGYAKPIAEGVELDVLNTVGIGHYPDTAMPGQLGNVGLAGHRQTHGQVFWDMDKLAYGDKAYIQTQDGIYIFTYEETTIVHPSQGEVLFPVPGDAVAAPTRKMLTLTTCHPPFTTDMRMVVHLEQTDFIPADVPAPSPIREVVLATTGIGG